MRHAHIQYSLKRFLRTSLTTRGKWPKTILLRALALLMAGGTLHQLRDGLGAVVVRFIHEEVSFPPLDTSRCSSSSTGLTGLGRKPSTMNGHRVL